MSSLSGRQALVAGGAVGNLPAVRALVEAGAQVVLQAQTPDEIESASKAASELGDLVEVSTESVVTFADAQALVDGLVADRGTLDVLLTPVVPDAAPSLVELDQSAWLDFKATAITRPVALVRAATGRMVDQPGGGRVVVFGSATTFLAPGAAQASANAAMLSLTSAASAGLADTSVRVNAILLGKPGAHQGGIPAPSGDLDMLGAATAWLAGEESDSVRGKFVYVGGSDIGYYTMPMLMENANVQVRFDGEADAGTVGQFLNNLVDIGKVQRQA